MVKKWKAWVVAVVAIATSPMVVSQRRSLAEEDNIIGEFPPKVISITLRYASLPQEEIIWIFYNKFKPINHYQVRHIRGLYFDSM